MGKIKTLLEIIDLSNCTNILMEPKYPRGKNPNSRRKPSGVEWKTVSFRIKEEWREAIKIVVRKDAGYLHSRARGFTGRFKNRFKITVLVFIPKS